MTTLTTQLLFFFDHGLYRIVNSRGSAEGNALIELEGPDLVWRLTRDREQVSIECRLRDGHPEDWFSLDILMRLLGESCVDSLVSDSTARWLKAALPDLHVRLSGPQRESTLKAIRKLERERAKRLFG